MSGEDQVSQQEFAEEYIVLLPKDRRKCAVVADAIIVQCIFVFLGSLSILYCVWSPDDAAWDCDKLVRVMYLFDFHACGYKMMKTKEFPNLQFSNDTQGYDVVPVKWMPAVTTVSTRLTERTRMYIELSLSLHVIWLFIIIVNRTIIKQSTNVRTLHINLAVFFYSCIVMIFFDVSMALLYISHIKQSLTKGMVLRYSGWSNTMKLTSYEDFAGWIPIVASFCWLRGVIFFLMNIYGCKTIKKVSRKIKKREIKWKYEKERYTAVPEARPVYTEGGVLIYRAGEHKASQF